ncbi:ABC transporter permease [Gordoniibacillus kamchatkensis]|uniref:ABC transporter permease n=1 Tax=Gordoniibacillus kamchatkensis TaxID=1590651 RepID=A0ABR5ACN0_9BACL|nr:carbohydrate ABC transporter permease [Paenibacillus sp. VKM B-2647]KIL38433.1 ABC transporter permease [Paenibacillus sp. VKM B-2647]
MRLSVWRAAQYALLLAAAAAIAFPFIWMVLTSLKPEGEIVRFPPALFPSDWTLDAYVQVWKRIPFLLFFKNSVVFACGVTLISLAFDSMAAYAFARLAFPGKHALFVLVLIALMIPVQVTMIPLFIMLNDWGWIDTYAALIVPRATNAFGIFMLRQFFVGLPKELDEAARIDGCSEFRLYWQIVLPLAKPAVASLAVFHLMYNWNDLLWPLIITNSQEMRTLPAGLALFMGQHVVEYGILTAGAAIATAPLVAAFLSAQKYFVQGVAFTGLKE